MSSEAFFFWSGWASWFSLDSFCATLSTRRKITLWPCTRTRNIYVLCVFLCMFFSFVSFLSCCFFSFVFHLICCQSVFELVFSSSVRHFCVYVAISVNWTSSPVLVLLVFVASFLLYCTNKTIHCTVPAFDRVRCAWALFLLFFSQLLFGRRFFFFFSRRCCCCFFFNLFHQLFIFIFFSFVLYSFSSVCEYLFPRMFSVFGQLFFLHVCMVWCYGPERPSTRREATQIFAFQAYFRTITFVFIIHF